MYSIAWIGDYAKLVAKLLFYLFQKSKLHNSNIFGMDYPVNVALAAPYQSHLKVYPDSNRKYDGARIQLRPENKSGLIQWVK